MFTIHSQGIDITSYPTIAEQSWKDEYGNDRKSSYAFDDNNNIMYIVNDNNDLSTMSMSVNLFNTAMQQNKPTLIQKRALNYLKDRGKL